MSLTKSRLTQAHGKAARAVGHLALAVQQEKVGRMALRAAIDDLNSARALLESILNAQG